MEARVGSEGQFCYLDTTSTNSHLLTRITSARVYER